MEGLGKKNFGMLWPTGIPINGHLVDFIAIW
jgi:hypothetical protein